MIFALIYYGLLAMKDTRLLATSLQFEIVLC